MDKNAKIFVAGGTGMVGSAIVRKLKSEGYTNILTPGSKELNLTQQEAVVNFFEKEKPEYVFLAAAKVGGILANNDFPADFLYENLMIEANVIHTSYLYKVTKLLFLGSSCIYPKFAKQPITEEELMTGPLEATNEAYAVAKITGIELCKFYKKQYGCDFISTMPSNLYGINDNFDLNSSHVLPALLRKFHDAKVNNIPEVVIWGSGTPRREFLYVDDLAEASLFLMDNYDGANHINVGTGLDIEIKELAEKIKQIVGYQGSIVHDTSKPDGTPRKVLDIEKIKALGWSPKVSLDEGIERVYRWYLTQ